MERLVQMLAAHVQETGELNARDLAHYVRLVNTGVSDIGKHVSKKKLLPFYLALRQDTARMERLGISNETDAVLLQSLRAKPRRTSSGVATITVITKPHACTSSCVYCPNDVRMPKSYLANEPACQRAERNFFDPYLQVAARLRALEAMGHITDKVELIVLGSTWSEYEEGYRVWFVTELFRALNASSAEREKAVLQRRKLYEDAGISNDPLQLEQAAAHTQKQVCSREITFAQAIERLYGVGTPWSQISAFQTACYDELAAEHAVNEDGEHRVVGLVVETRPSLVTPAALMELRRLGCTKVQVGVQTLDGDVTRSCGRSVSPGDVEECMKLLRLFGFKIHSHFMANLPGATLESDLKDYSRFVSEPAYRPDEVKLYPCMLIESAGLTNLYESGQWTPYADEDLVELLAQDVLATPSFTRISRMIRDFSAEDIVAGCKQTNLRQAVDERISQLGAEPVEIRSREIDSADVHMGDLRLDTVSYETVGTVEHFLQWVTPSGGIAGFLRLSLPDMAHVEALGSVFPVGLGEAMIREVHVYGKVAGIGGRDGGAQHQGLGTQLIEQACSIAKDSGYESINVISAVGTRGYYRKRGFKDNGLYQQRAL